MNNSNWPTAEEIEQQQSPFDPNGSFPFDYKIVIVEQIGENLFQEQLRTYTISEVLREDDLRVPEQFTVDLGRQFRVAEDGEKADIHIMNQELSQPIPLCVVEAVSRVDTE